MSRRRCLSSLPISSNSQVLSTSSSICSYLHCIWCVGFKASQEDGTFTSQHMGNAITNVLSHLSSSSSLKTNPVGLLFRGALTGGACSALASKFQEKDGCIHFTIKARSWRGNPQHSALPFLVLCCLPPSRLECLTPSPRFLWAAFTASASRLAATPSLPQYFFPSHLFPDSCSRASNPNHTSRQRSSCVLLVLHSQ
jgi:hypothetical protein